VNFRVIAALAAVVLGFAVAGAEASGKRIGSDSTLSNPLLLTVAGRCTRLIRRAGSETLINTCNTCLMVNLARKRSGIALPVRRSFSLAAKSTFPVPFRGPGRTRITSEVPCKGTAGEAPNLASPDLAQKPKEDGPIQCVQLKQGSSGNPVLVNACTKCRAAAIRRMNAAGSPMGQQAYLLQPKAIVSIDARGAAAVGLLADIDCPS